MICNLHSNSPDCIDGCKPFVDKWAGWCHLRNETNLAMLEITEDYVSEVLDSKSRNMVRKANGHLDYRRFNYNHYLDDIFDVNTSTPERQGKPMSASYLSQPSPIIQPHTTCNIYHEHVFYGGFSKQDNLRGYAALAVVGDVAIVNTIIGHVHDKPLGVINGLIAHIVDDLYFNSQARYINYLDLTSCGIGLRNFKESVGFKEYKVSFVY